MIGLGLDRKTEKWLEDIDELSRSGYYHDISSLAGDPLWNAMSPPAQLVEALDMEAKKLVELLNKARCTPSMLPASTQ